MYDYKNNGKIPFDRVSKELSGYRLRLELVRSNPQESKAFEDLDHGSVVGYFIQCFPGFETSYGSSFENLSDLDEFEEGFDE